MQLPVESPSIGRAILATLGVALLGLGGLVLVYAIGILVQQPLYFIVAVPVGLFGLLLIALGAVSLLPWWRIRRRRQRTG